MDIKIQEDIAVLLFDKIVEMDDLIHELSERIKLFETNGILKSN